MPDPAGHRPGYSEFIWESPDGSRIPALFFSGWYDNGREIPVDPERARPYWDERLARAMRSAATEHLLFMNGSDHQPVQRDLPEALETARRLYPDITFIQSDLERFAACVLESLKAPPETVRGELEGQETAGDNTLCNTASFRGPLKAMNRKNESMLERRTEPLLAMAAMAGARRDDRLLDRAWMLLMQNHPHDSICGCSIDQVYREMEDRYQRSMQLGRLLADEAGRYLSSQIAVPGAADGAAFAVWNTSAWTRTEVTETVVSVERVYETAEAREALLSGGERRYRLTDGSGREIPCHVFDTGVHFGFDLPEDSFRRPYFERRMKVVFQAEDIPAFGYRVFCLREGAASPSEGSLMSGKRQMENRFVRVSVRPNGTFDITDKRTGRIYSGLGYDEDAGDVGDEYVFRETAGGRVDTLGARPDIVCVEDSPYRATFRITYALELPESADEALGEAVRSMQPRLRRVIGRSRGTAAMELRTFLTLTEGSAAVRFRTEFDNRARDHRLRAVFPTDLDTGDHLADSVFDVVRRPDVPGPAWTNPSRCRRMQYMAAAEDAGGGIAVFNRGAYEYEVLPTRKALAVTLIRSVSELGDWGVFPTPEAQCQGPFAMDMEILSYAPGELLKSGCREAGQFQSDMPVFQIFEPEGTLPERGSFLECGGDGLAFTAFKISDDGYGYILRLFNTTGEPTVLTMGARPDCVYFRSDVLERKIAPVYPEPDGRLRIPVRGKEIVTVRFEKA